MVLTFCVNMIDLVLISYASILCSYRGIKLLYYRWFFAVVQVAILWYGKRKNTENVFIIKMKHAGRSTLWQNGLIMQSFMKFIPSLF